MAILAFAGWQRRWLCDDAFINYRVLAQIGAGNGPVYNAGERVEVGTSTLWLITVGLGHLVSQVRLEIISIVLSIVAAVAGVAFGVAGARRMLTGRRDEDHDVWWLPLGVLVFVATSAAWDWSTGGLENGLTWCWLGGAFLLTVRASPTAPTTPVWASVPRSPAGWVCWSGPTSPPTHWRGVAWSLPWCGGRPVRGAPC